MPRLLLILIACCSLGLIHSAEERKGAFFNPRVSSRSIAFNQVVRVTFTTIPAQIPEVDVLSTVRSALALPSALADWRLYREPMVVVHERLLTIEVSFALQPRHPGVLPLPSIPVRWLNGDQVGEFGTVAVGDEILVGNQPRPIPLELSAVAGFSWETPYALLKQQIGEPVEIEKGPVDTARSIFKPAEHVEIECRGMLMHSIRIHSTGMDLDQARSSFIDRWGEPTSDESGNERPRLTWVIGWLRITATQTTDQAGPGISLELLREDVAQKLMSKQIEQKVFDILDGK
jgi:hypothetical protein